MSVAQYRDADTSLPWMGGGALGPRRLTLDHARAVMAAGDPLALALMRGYARSYAGALSGAVQGTAAAVALAMMGRRRESALAALGAGACALAVVEARRRARQWESVIEARQAQLAAERS